jgi:hypothetical protein
MSFFKTFLKIKLLTLCLTNLPVFADTVFTPEKILPEGVDAALSKNPYTGETGYVRKATVAATLNNIAVLNELLGTASSTENLEKNENYVKAIKELLPSLRVIGVFNLFTPLEWLSAENQPGRVLTVLLYLQRYSDAITPKIKKTLRHLQIQEKIPYLLEMIKLILKNNE